MHCNTLLHTATHRNTPQHTATHRNTLQHTATYTTRSTALRWMRCERKRSHSTWPCYCNTLPHAAIRCHTLQHTATHCNTIRQPPGERGRSHSTWPCHPFPLTLKCAKRVKRSVLTRKENYEKDLFMQYLTLASISSESEVWETWQMRHVNERDQLKVVFVLVFDLTVLSLQSSCVWNSQKETYWYEKSNNETHLILPSCPSNPHVCETGQ